MTDIVVEAVLPQTVVRYFLGIMLLQTLHKKKVLSIKGRTGLVSDYLQPVIICSPVTSDSGQDSSFC